MPIILFQVPLVVTETLGIGSMAPGALLLEAAKGFQVLVATESFSHIYKCIVIF